MKRLPLVLLCLIGFVNVLCATPTPRKFHEGAFIGGHAPFVFAEGWYLYGGQTGIYSDLRVRKRIAARVELAYSQNAGYIRPLKYPTWPEQQRARFSYVEVPLLIRFIPRQREKEFQLSVYGGVTYTRLFDYRVQAKSGFELTDQVTMKSDHALVPLIGACLMFKHMGAEVRIAQPLDWQTGVNCSARINFQI